MSKNEKGLGWDEEARRLWLQVRETCNATLEVLVGKKSVDYLEKVAKRDGVDLQVLLDARAKGVKVRLFKDDYLHEISASIIRFFYYTELIKRVPWGLVGAEIAKEFNKRVSGMRNAPEIYKSAFYSFSARKRGKPGFFRKEFLEGEIFGATKIKAASSGHIVSLIAMSEVDAAARILFEGLEAPLPVAQIYKRWHESGKVVHKGSVSRKLRYGFSRRASHLVQNEIGQELLKSVFVENREKWEQWKKETWEGKPIRIPFYKHG